MLAHGGSGGLLLHLSQEIQLLQYLCVPGKCICVPGKCMCEGVSSVSVHIARVLQASINVLMILTKLNMTIKTPY